MRPFCFDFLTFPSKYTDTCRLLFAFSVREPKVMFTPPKHVSNPCILTGYLWWILPLLDVSCIISPPILMTWWGTVSWTTGKGVENVSVGVWGLGVVSVVRGTRFFCWVTSTLNLWMRLPLNFWENYRKRFFFFFFLNFPTNSFGEAFLFPVSPSPRSLVRHQDSGYWISGLMIFDDNDLFKYFRETWLLNH